jgi:hypothetical protein
MSRTFAEINDGIVERVVVCDDPAWLAEKLGGNWVETKTEDPVEHYAGPGMGHDPAHRSKFAPVWDPRLQASKEDISGMQVFDGGKIREVIKDGDRYRPEAETKI